MANSEIQKLKKLNIGTEKSKPQDIYTEYLIELGRAISDAFKEYIEDNNISASGTLGQSIVSIPVSNFEVEIRAEDYFNYLEQGVNGTLKGYGAPFSFKYSRPSKKHADAIKKWIPTRGLSLPSGFSSFDSYSYAIATKVKERGIEPRNIIDGVMTKDTLKEIEEQLFDLTGVIMNFTFNRTTEDINKI